MRSIAAFAVSTLLASVAAAQSAGYPNPYPVYPPQGSGYGAPAPGMYGGGVNQGMYGQGGGVGPGMYGSGGGFGQGMYGQGMYGQGMYGQDPNGERPKARGLFALTLAGLLAQGVGGGLSQGLGGSIVKWFSGEPKQAQANPAAAQALAPQAMAPQGFATEAVAPQAGLAFEVHLLATGGMSTPVDPGRHVFRTGDRFVVHYRPTLPGRVQVFNINGQGSSAQIDAAVVAAGQLATLGPYEFVETPGDEALRITLEPCSTQALMAATRSIVRAGATEGGMQLTDCGDARVAGMRTRGITKVAMDGSTGFALDPVSQRELASGNLAAREVTIRLLHR